MTFATKPALAAGARPAWVVADAVYGADYKLRVTLEEDEQPYVLAVGGQQCVWIGFGQRRVKAVKTQVPADAGQRSAWPPAPRGHVSLTERR